MCGHLLDAVQNVLHYIIIFPLYSLPGAEVLRGAFSDFYTGPVYSGMINCTSDYTLYSLNDCRLTPGMDETCAGDASRAVGFSCVRGTFVNCCLILLV